MAPRSRIGSLLRSVLETGPTTAERCSGDAVRNSAKNRCSHANESSLFGTEQTEASLPKRRTLNSQTPLTSVETDVLKPQLVPRFLLHSAPHADVVSIRVHAK